MDYFGSVQVRLKSSLDQIKWSGDDRTAHSTESAVQQYQRMMSYVKVHVRLTLPLSNELLVVVSAVEQD